MFHMARLKIITRKFYAIKLRKTEFQIKTKSFIWNLFKTDEGLYAFILNQIYKLGNLKWIFKRLNFYTCIMVPVLPSIPSFAFSSDVINARLPGLELAN